MNILLIPIGVFVWWYIGYITLCIVDKITKTEPEEDEIEVAFAGLLVPIVLIVLGIVTFLVWLPQKILGIDKE